jgi:serine O-acetyltransferase
MLEVVVADAVAYGARSQGITLTLLKGLRHPGFRMTLCWRIASAMASRGVPLLPQFLRQVILHLFSCDLSLNAHLAGGVRFPHPVGVVIGDATEVGSQTTLMQHCTLGGNFGQIFEGRQTPRLGAQVFVGPGAVVVGPVDVPSGTRIGANRVVASTGDSTRNAR